MSLIKDLPDIDFRKPHCKHCRGECALVLVMKADDTLCYEWECMKCHKSFKANGYRAPEFKKRNPKPREE